jgi:hypothetical protein
MRSPENDSLDAVKGMWLAMWCGAGLWSAALIVYLLVR